MYVVKQCNNRVICRWLLKCHFQFAMNAWQLFAPSISSLSPPCWPQTTCLINILTWISVQTTAKTLSQPFFSSALFSFSFSFSLSFSFSFLFLLFFLFLFLFSFSFFFFFLFTFFPFSPSFFFCSKGFFLCRTSFFRSRRFKTYGYGYGGRSLRLFLRPKILFVVFLFFFPKWRLKCKLSCVFITQVPPVFRLD